MAAVFLTLVVVLAMYFASIEMMKLSLDERTGLILDQAKKMGWSRQQRRLLEAEVARYKQISNKRARLSEPEKRFIRDFEEKWFTRWEESFRRITSENAEKIRFTELIPAYDEGLLTFEPFALSGSAEEMVRGYVNKVGDLVVSGDSFPMFDDRTGELIRLAIKHQLLEPSEARVTHSSHAALPLDVLERLPLFPDASIKEIIQIRGQLTPYLAKFRAAMLDYSASIKVASWDKDFPVVAQQLFFSKIAPEVQAIEEAVKGDSILRSVLKEILKDKWVLPSTTLASISAMTGAVGMLISQDQGLGEAWNAISSTALPVISGAAGMSAGINAARVAIKEKLEQVERHKIHERNNMFLFYYTKKLLGK